MNGLNNDSYASLSFLERLAFLYTVIHVNERVFYLCKIEILSTI